MNDTTAFLSFPSERTCLEDATTLYYKIEIETTLRLSKHHKQIPNFVSHCSVDCANFPWTVNLPHTEESIVSRPREEVESIAVRWTGGGEAQGRNHGGVTGELL